MDSILILNDAVTFDPKAILTSLTPMQNIWIDRWAFIDFNLGQIHYKTNGSAASFTPSSSRTSTPASSSRSTASSDDFEISTGNAANLKILGTTGLDTCTGLVVVSQHCAIVAHFSAGSLSMGTESPTALATSFANFLRSRTRYFQGLTLAYIFRASRIVHRIGSREVDPRTRETITRWAFVPIEVRMDESDTTGVWRDVEVLKGVLAGAGLPEANLKILTECHPYVDGRGPGEAVVLVDGRGSPGAWPRVYAKFYGGVAPM